MLILLTLYAKKLQINMQIYTFLVIVFNEIKYRSFIELFNLWNPLKYLTFSGLVNGNVHLNTTQGSYTLTVFKSKNGEHIMNHEQLIIKVNL